MYHQMQLKLGSPLFEDLKDIYYIGTVRQKFIKLNSENTSLAVRWLI